MATIADVADNFSLAGNKLLDRARRSWRMMTSPLRRLPDVVIVGAQKGGTTSLYRYLCQHPSISGARTKEVHYFDNNHDRHPLWYRSNFDVEGPGVAVEATPKYLFHEVTLWRMSVLLPDVTVVALLREPVARAYSHYKHVQRRMGKWGTDHRSFPEAARADIQAASEKGGLGANSYKDIYHSYVRRGMYAPQVRRFKEVYGDQMMVVRSRDLFAETQRVLGDIFDKIGVARVDVETENVHKSGQYEEGIPIREELERFFRPHNEELYELLDVETWWDY
jgi:hypothetical protein